MKFLNKSVKFQNLKGKYKTETRQINRNLFNRSVQIFEMNNKKSGNRNKAIKVEEPILDPSDEVKDLRRI